MDNQNNKDTRQRALTRVTVTGGISNLLLMLLKMAAGIIGRSGAMVADAIHSLSDFLTDAVVLLFVRISAKPDDESHDYGPGKFETLATCLIAVALFVVAISILIKSAMAIAGVTQGQVLPQPGLIALLAAAISIIVKEGLYWYTYLSGKKWDSQVVIANAWHHRSDACVSWTPLPPSS